MIEYLALSDKGKIRSHNEDAIMLPHRDDDLCAELGYLFVLCDGLGGYAGGEVASANMVKWFSDLYYFQFNFPDEPLENLKWILNRAEKELEEQKRENSLFAAMSTTIVTALFYYDKLYVLSVGDSRLYRLRNEQLEQLTEDHSVVWNMYKKNTLTKEEMRNHTMRHIVTSAVGIGDDYDIYTATYETLPGDVYLLCSDGLTDALSDSEILLLLQAGGDIRTLGENLLQTALEEGGEDNITLALIRIG